MLRLARERRKLTLQAVSETTKISPGVLTALESNDIEHLPGGLFIRSFVRAYATEVGLDPEETVNALLDAFPDLQPERLVRSREDLSVAERAATQPGVARTAVRLIVLSAIVVAVLIFFGLRGSNAPSETDDPDNPTNSSESGDPSSPNDPGSPVVAGTPIVAAPVPVRGPVAVESLTIAVHPTAACWVSLTIDGEQVFAGVMGSGDQEVYEAENQIVLNVGDAGLFEFSINQEPGRSLGEPGQVVTVEIDRDNYQSFVRTLH